MKIRIRTLVLIWLCALAAISYFQRTLGVAESTIRTQLELTKDQMGVLQSCFFWSYALFQVPTAWLGHRLGPRFGLTVFCLTWSLATGLTGVTNSFWVLCAARFIVGLGQAAALPGIAEAISVWFPQSVRGRATALIAASMQVGAGVNALVTDSLMSQFGLMGFFWALAIPGFVWSLGFYAWFRDQPAEFSILSPSEVAELPIPHHKMVGAGEFSWRKLVTSPVLWLICGQQFCRAAGYIFFATWFATYVQETQHFDVKQSGIATSCTFGGVLFGAIFGGVVSDWILHYTGSVRWSRQGVAIISLLLCALCIAGSFVLAGDETTAASKLNVAQPSAKRATEIAPQESSSSGMDRSPSSDATKRASVTALVPNKDVATSGDHAMVAILSMSLMTLGAFFSGVGGSAGYTVTMDVSGKSVAMVFGFMNMAGNLGAALFPMVIPLLLGPSRDHWDLVIYAFIGLYLTSAFFWSLINPHRTVFGESQSAVEGSR